VPTPEAALLQAHSLIAQAVNELYGSNSLPVGDSNDDPLTAKLGPFGEWQPAWLKAKADAAAAKYPNGLAQGTEVGFDGKPRVTQVAWPSHFVWSGCLARADLTEQQNLMLLYADQQGFGQGILNAAADTPAWQYMIVVTRGPWTALLNGRQVHTDLPNLREETERYFARYVGV
jgi:hypothetical protein